MQIARKKKDVYLQAQCMRALATEFDHESVPSSSVKMRPRPSSSAPDSPDATQRRRAVSDPVNGNKNVSMVEIDVKDSMCRTPKKSESFPDGVSLTSSHSKSRRSAFSDPTQGRSSSTRMRMTAPIMDIAVIFGKDEVPPGFVRISKTRDGKKANLNRGGGGKVVWLCYRCGSNVAYSGSPYAAARGGYMSDNGGNGGIGQNTSDSGYLSGNGSETNASERVVNPSSVGATFVGDGVKREPITGITIIFVDKGEFPPPGYTMISHTPYGLPANLNAGSSGPRIFLCIRRGDGIPIVNIDIIQINSKERLTGHNGMKGDPPRPKDGANLLRWTPLGIDANLNSGPGGTDSYLTYKRDWGRWEDLAATPGPGGYAARIIFPLILAVCDTSPDYFFVAIESLRKLLIGERNSSVSTPTKILSQMRTDTPAAFEEQSMNSNSKLEGHGKGVASTITEEDSFSKANDNINAMEKTNPSGLGATSSTGSTSSTGTTGADIYFGFEPVRVGKLLRGNESRLNAKIDDILSESQRDTTSMLTGDRILQEPLPLVDYFHSSITSKWNRTESYNNLEDLSLATENEKSEDEKEKKDTSDSIDEKVEISQSSHTFKEFNSLRTAMEIADHGLGFRLIDLVIDVIAGVTPPTVDHEHKTISSLQYFLLSVVVAQPTGLAPWTLHRVVSRLIGLQSFLREKTRTLSGVGMQAEIAGKVHEARFYIKSVRRGENLRERGTKVLSKVISLVMRRLEERTVQQYTSTTGGPNDSMKGLKTRSPSLGTENEYAQNLDKQYYTPGKKTLSAVPSRLREGVGAEVDHPQTPERNQTISPSLVNSSQSTATVITPRGLSDAVFNPCAATHTPLPKHIHQNNSENLTSTNSHQKVEESMLTNDWVRYMIIGLVDRIIYGKTVENVLTLFSRHTSKNPAWDRKLAMGICRTTVRLFGRVSVITNDGSARHLGSDGCKEFDERKDDEKVFETEQQQQEWYELYPYGNNARSLKLRSVVGDAESRYVEQDIFLLLALLCKYATTFLLPVSSLATTIDSETTGYSPMAFRNFSHVPNGKWQAARIRLFLPEQVELKACALRGLSTVLNEAGDVFRSSRRFCLSVRRLACNAVVSNFDNVTMDLKTTFGYNLRLLSVLWNRFRALIKIEFAVIWKKALYPVLCSAKAAPHLRLGVLQEMGKWCEVPHNMVDMFLNFDNDQLITHCSLFRDMCHAMTDIAVGPLNSVRENDDLNTNGGVSPSHASAKGGKVTVAPPNGTPKERKVLQYIATRSLSQMCRSLMDASAMVHLIEKNPKTRAMAMSQTGGWSRDDQMETNEDGDEADGEEESSPNVSHSLENEEASDSTGVVNRNDLSRYGVRRRSSVRLRHAMRTTRRQVLEKALAMAEAKDGLKKPFKYLVANNYIRNTIHDHVSIMRLHREKLDPQWIGDYLGEEGADEAERAFFNEVRREYVRTLGFSGLGFVAGLRRMFTHGGFMLPKEAQKIERLIVAFSEQYHHDNPGVFSHADTVYFLSYSTILLNTSMHNPKVKRKMTPQEWEAQNANCDPPPQPNGKNLPRSTLLAIYDSIVHAGIEMPGAMLNIELPGHTRRRNRRLAPAEEAAKAEANFRKEMRGRAGLAMSLLRQQAFRDRSYYSKTTADLVRLQFELVWLEVVLMVERLVNNHDVAVAPKSVRVCCLDILLYGLSTSLFLSMVDARRGFGGLLGKTYMLESARHGEDGDALASDDFLPNVDEDNELRSGTVTPPSASDGEDGNGAVANVLSERHLQQQWYKKMIVASSKEDIESTIARVHGLVSQLKDLVQTKFEHVKLRELQERFVPNANIMKDDRQLILEATLTKISTRGAKQRYQFFLFNDVIVYAKKGFFSGRFKPRRVLALESLRTRDVNISPSKSHRRNSSVGKNSFRIEHPEKSFTVICKSPQEKRQWLRAINEARQRCFSNIVDSESQTSFSLQSTLFERVKQQKKEQQQSEQSESQRKEELVMRKLRTRSSVRVLVDRDEKRGEKSKSKRQILRENDNDKEI
eukprot:g2963.t1